MSVQDSAEEGFDKLKDTLSKKIGPLPLGGWLAGGLGGLLIAMYLRRRGATEDAPIEEGGGTTQPGAGNLGDTGGGGGSGGGGGTAPKPTTNEEWWTRATELILAAGGYTGTAVTTALTKYLAGEPLAGDEQAIVNMAIRLAGPPPYPPPLPLPGIPTPQPDPPEYEPPPQPQPGNQAPAPAAPKPAAPKPAAPKPGTTGTTQQPGGGVAAKPLPNAGKPKPVPANSGSKPPPPAPKPKAPKVTVKSYTTKKGDTLAKIGQKYGVSWQKIWDYNTDPKNRTAAAIKTIKSRGPNGLVAGSLFLVPVPA